MKRAVFLAVVVLVAGLVYYRVGWTRMETYCDGGPHPNVHETAHFSWSWKPVGFRCTYEDGSSDTSFWPDHDQWAPPKLVTSYSNGLRFVKSKDFVWLTKDVPENVAGMGTSGTLTKSSGGCVGLRGHSGSFRPIIWPTGTWIDSRGTIHLGAGTLKVGQEVIGGGELWDIKQLKPSRAVTHICPAMSEHREYLQVDVSDLLSKKG